MLTLLTIFLLGKVITERLGLLRDGALLTFPASFIFGSIVFTYTAFTFSLLFASQVEESLRLSFWFSTAIAWIIITFYLYKKKNVLLNFSFKSFLKKEKTELFLIFISLFASFLFFKNHLFLRNDLLVRSLIFWDFPLHFARINSFIRGNNFPPLDPLFGGAPLTYHFMFHVLEALFVVGGLRIDLGLLLVSILSFSSLLMMIAKISLSIGLKLRGSVLALVLFLTSSNLRFLYDIKMYLKEGYTYFKSPAFIEPFKNTQFRYDWYEFYSQHFNLFYFLEERRLSFACAFMMLVIYIFAFKKNELNKKQLTAFGIFVGLFFFWHLQAALLLSLIIFLTFIFKSDERKKYLGIITTAVTLISIQILFIRYLQSDSRYFQETIEKMISFDFSFPSPDNEASFLSTIRYILLAYGVKIILLPLGLSYIYYESRSMFFLLTYALLGIVIAFTLKLNTGHIHENHKWIVLSAASLNIIAAAGFISLFSYISKKLPSFFMQAALAAPIILLLTYAGIIENAPFFVKTSYALVGKINSPMIDYVDKNFPKDSIFLTTEWTQVHLTGRAVYLTPRSNPAVGLAIKHRSEAQRLILESKEIASLCELLKKERITGILYDTNDEHFSVINLLLSKINNSYKDFETPSQNIRIVDTGILCATEGS